MALMSLIRKYVWMACEIVNSRLSVFVVFSVIVSLSATTTSNSSSKSYGQKAFVSSELFSVNVTAVQFAQALFTPPNSHIIWRAKPCIGLSPPSGCLPNHGQQIGAPPRIGTPFT